jgi:hypothetical protein
MDDDVFEALIMTLAIACENRPDRAQEVKERFMRTIRANQLNIDDGDMRDDVALVIGGRRMRGWITRCNVRYGAPLDYSTNAFGRGPVRRDPPGIELSLELSCQEVP